MQGRDMKTNHFWYQSMPRWETHSWLWLNNAPARANDIPFWRWCDWITVTPLRAAAHITISQIINIAIIYNEVTHMTIHCIFLVRFHLIHIVWPSSSLHAFPPLSWTGYTSKTYSTNPLWNRAALLHATLLWVQLPVHTVWFVYVCECQCDKLNTDDVAGERSSLYVCNPGSILHPPSSLHYLLLLSF